MPPHANLSLPAIVPAQLSFLGIYNPDLGPTEETFKDQVVYWYSRDVEQRRKRYARQGNHTEAEQARAEQEEENEKLRQIGLAQGIIGFAKGFANGQPADAVDTLTSRFVIQELELGWWLIISIDLTRITTRANPIKGDDPLQGPKTEYSSKEVSPSALLAKQLENAYRIFLLHNGRSLSDLYVRLPRDGFCKLLARFWDNFVQEWDVLLHGSPAVEFFSGIKLSAGGELGMGVGEEEWGSGERDVLEGLINETDGCVDIVVARYGEAPVKPETGQHPDRYNAESPSQETPWLGVAAMQQPSDGVIFTGANNISRRSLREVSDWMDWVHTYGEAAYGVRDNPRSGRRRSRPNMPRAPKTSTSIASRRSKPRSQEQAGQTDARTSSPRPGIPPPIVSAAEESLDEATKGADRNAAREPVQTQTSESKSSERHSDSWMKILTFGLAGSERSERKNPSPENVPDHTASRTTKSRLRDSVDRTADLQEVEPLPDVDIQAEKAQEQIRHENEGYFLIGLKGGLDEQFADDEDADNRILLRTMYIETTTPQTPYDDETPTVYSARSMSFSGGSITKKMRRLRVLLYVQRPFIYTFLFQVGTDALTLSSFYRNLHKFLGSMHRGLNLSTSPDRVAQRLRNAGGSYATSAASHSSIKERNDSKTSQQDQAETEPIFDLIYDPQTLNIHANVPSIPYPGALAAEALGGAASKVGWTRADALNVHSAIIEGLLFAEKTGTSESSLKTSRGWWIVYMKVAITDSSDNLTPKADDQGEKRSVSDVSSPREVAEGLREAISEPHTPSIRSQQPQEQQQGTITTATLTKPRSRSTKSVKSRPSDINKRGVTPPSSAHVSDSTSTSRASQGSYFPSAPSSTATPRQPAYKEAVLIRRARDSISSSGRGGPSATTGGVGGGLWSFGSNMLGGGGNSGKDAGSGWGPARLAEGVGVDAKKYVEGLIGLGR